MKLLLVAVSWQIASNTAKSETGRLSHSGILRIQGISPCDWGVLRSMSAAYQK